MNPGIIKFAYDDGTYVLKLVGEIRLTLCATLEAFLERVFKEKDIRSIVVDVSESTTIDSTSLGLLAKLSIQSNSQFQVIPVLFSNQDDINRILYSMGFDGVFNLVDHFSGLDKLEMTELKSESYGEQSSQSKVLEAHKVLMDLNDDNREAFKDLVKQLEVLEASG